MKNEEVKNNVTKKDVSKKTTSKKETSKDTKKKANIEQEVVVEKRKVEVSTNETPNKRNDMFLILGLVVVVVLGFFAMKGKSVETTYELPLTLSGEVGLHQLTYEEYQEKIDNKEEFVVILERATCPHCVTYLPVAEQFAKDNNVPMYYVDTDTFTAEDWEGFEKSNSYLKKSKGNWGTPTTVVLVGSQAVSYIEGASTAEDLLELYNEYFEMENK